MGTGGADSPHSHAQVFCLNDDGDPLGIQFFFQKIRYLGGKPLLELRPTGKAIDNPRQLGKADDCLLYTSRCV